MREWWTKCPQRKKQMKFWLHISQLHNSYALDTNHTLVFEFSSLESKQCSRFFPLCPIFDLSSWKSQLKEKEYDWCSTLGFSSSENKKKHHLIWVIDFFSDDANAVQRWCWIKIFVFLHIVSISKPTVKYKKNTIRDSLFQWYYCCWFLEAKIERKSCGCFLRKFCSMTSYK